MLEHKYTCMFKRTKNLYINTNYVITKAKIEKSRVLEKEIILLGIDVC